MRRETFENTLAVVVVLVIVLAIVGVAFAAVSKGSKAIPFKLPALSGKMLSLDDIRKDPLKKGQNRVVVMDFWATWCPPCQEETAVLQKLQNKYGSKGVVVVGISLDAGGAKDVSPFMKEHKLSYLVLLDPRSSVGRQYGVRGIPATFILDRNGIIKQQHVGYEASMEKGLEDEVKALLR